MDRPVRKQIRLDNYGYSKNGLYFITICTKDRSELLWSTNVGDGALDVPLCSSYRVNKVFLSTFGRIVRDNIRRANSVYLDKKILQYVIMPNHIHFILKINASLAGMLMLSFLLMFRWLHNSVMVCAELMPILASGKVKERAFSV